MGTQVPAFRLAGITIRPRGRDEEIFDRSRHARLYLTEGETLAIQLKLTHEEGLRLRQQTAHKVERADKIAGEGGVPVLGTDWKFDRYQDATGKTVEEV